MKPWMIQLKVIVRGDVVLGDLRDRLRLHAVRQERRLELAAAASRRPRPRASVEVVDRRLARGPGTPRQRRAARSRCPTISSGAASCRTPMTVSRAVLPGLRVASRRPATGAKRAVLEVEAGEPEVAAARAKSKLSRRGHDRRRRPRDRAAVRSASPDLRSVVVAARRAPRGRTSCARGRRRRARGPGRSPPRPGRVHLASPRAARTTGCRRPEVGGIDVRVRVGSPPACRRSASAPAPCPRARRSRRRNRSTSLAACMNEPDETVPVTSVKTTSVNIASVRRCGNGRQRIGHRHPQHRRQAADPAEDAADAAEQERRRCTRSPTSRRRRPSGRDDDPGREVHRELAEDRLEDAPRQQPEDDDRAAPRRCRPAARAPEQAASGTSAISDRARRRAEGVACPAASAATPTRSSAERRRRASASTQRRRRRCGVGGSGRFRMAVEMVMHAHPPGRHRDHDAASAARRARTRRRMLLAC